MSKKIITHEESDEDLILRSLMKGKRPEIEQPAPSEEKQSEIQEQTSEEPVQVKEESKKRKAKAPDFVSTFLKENRTSSRKGKNINIRQEFHNKIRKILGIIAENDLSYFGYIDNILEHHFNMYEDEVNELLRKNNQL
ncbi:DUF3408 domain-containing protein [Dysgonomonas termitidis]|uniref:DUF3408 domain-containing protein n=1 Tax=Dysgonomonas termitidis TaxID=1516126 RepID=A0ABV9KZG5_9BACT